MFHPARSGPPGFNGDDDNDFMTLARGIPAEVARLPVSEGEVWHLDVVRLGDNPWDVEEPDSVLELQEEEEVTLSCRVTLGTEPRCAAPPERISPRVLLTAAPCLPPVGSSF